MQSLKQHLHQTICRTIADAKVQLTMLAMSMHSPNSPSNKNRDTNLQVLNVFSVNSTKGENCDQEDRKEKVISEFIWVDNESKDSNLVFTLAAKNMVAETVVAPFLLVATCKTTPNLSRWNVS